MPLEANEGSLLYTNMTAVRRHNGALKNMSHPKTKCSKVLYTSHYQNISMLGAEMFSRPFNETLKSPRITFWGVDRLQCRSLGFLRRRAQGEQVVTQFFHHPLDCVQEKFANC